MPLSFKAFMSSWVSFWDFPSSIIFRLSVPASLVSKEENCSMTCMIWNYLKIFPILSSYPHPAHQPLKSGLPVPLPPPQSTILSCHDYSKPLTHILVPTLVPLQSTWHQSSLFKMQIGSSIPTHKTTVASSSNSKTTCTVVIWPGPWLPFQGSFLNPCTQPHCPSFCSLDTQQHGLNAGLWHLLLPLSGMLLWHLQVGGSFPSLRAELTISAKFHIFQSAFSTPPYSTICTAHITIWNYAGCLFLVFPTAK